MSKLSCLLPLLLAAALPAQRCVYDPDNVPSNGGSNVIPFGSVSVTDANWSNQRYQQMVSTTLLGNVPGRICELAWAPSTSRVRQFKTIQITLAQTTATTMSTDFVANLGASPQVVLSATDYVWPVTQDTWNRIGLQTPFLYLPQNGNLIVEVLVTGAGAPTGAGSSAGFRSVSIPRLYKYGWTGTPPTTGTYGTSAGIRIEVCFDTNDLSVYGAGCQGSSGVPALSFQGSAQLGQSFSIDLANGTAVAALVLGLNHLPTPGDLTAAGAPGCSLYETLDFIFGIPTPNGVGSVKLPVPNDAGLVCAKLYTQYFPLDKAANSLGLTASNFGRILMGN